MRLLSLKNNERPLVHHIKQKHVLRRSVKMQVALTVNINPRNNVLFLIYQFNQSMNQNLFIGIKKLRKLQLLLQETNKFTASC